MAKRIGSGFNVTDASTNTTISVDSMTAATLLAADTAGLQSQQIRVWITNNGNLPLWVRFRAASLDNIKDGLLVQPGEAKIVSGNGSLYVGEISGIFDAGGPMDVMVSTL